jgi:F-box protein 11
MDMNQQVRQKLIALFEKDNQELLANYRKLSGLLFDHCPIDRKEIRAILTAFEEHIPEELIKGRNEPSKEMMVTRLTQKLLEASPMSDEAARWVVETWALALKVVSNSDLVKKQEIKPMETPVKKVDLSPVMTAEGPALIVSRLGEGQYKSIGEAIRAAAPNTRILVKAGLYKETLLLDKSLEIVGDGVREEIVIEATNCIDIHKNSILQIRLENLSLRGSCPITEGKFELNDCRIGSVLGSGNTQLFVNKCDVGTFKHDYRNDKNISIINTHIETMTISAKSEIICENSEIADLEIIKPSASILSSLAITNIYSQFKNCRFNFIKVEGGFPHFIECITRAGNIGNLRACGCMSISFGGSGYFDQCIFEGPDVKPAIIIEGNGKPVFRKCSITGKTKMHDSSSMQACERMGYRAIGIVFKEDTEGLVEDCEFINNHTGIEIVRGANPTIKNCTIIKNWSHGIWVHDNGAGVVENCEIKGNGKGAWKIEPGCPVRRNNNEE